MSAQPTRAYDSLYDRVYTVSGSRDFYRDQARAGGFTLERVPEYGNFFSEVPTYPSQTVRFRNVDKVPPSINREYHGPLAAPKAELYYKSNADRVSGNNRYMFFRRPLYAPTEQIFDDTPPNVVLAKHPSDGVNVHVSDRLEEAPKARTFGTQSDYRENETQTLPYEPDYVVPKRMSLKQQKLNEKYHLGGQPEVLNLQQFKYGEGLPVGLHEVTKIEKMREKRAFEASLPPLADASKLHIRKRMLDEWESKEWAYRENEIKEIQDERLQRMEAKLLMREERLEEDTKKRLVALERRKIKQNQSFLADIQKRRIKTMRKLEKRRALSGFKPEKPTRAEEYANYGSKVYAPLTRDGKGVESGEGQKIDPVPYQPRELASFADVQTSVRTETLDPHAYRRAGAGAGKEGKTKDRGEDKAAKVVDKQLEYVIDLLEESKRENAGRRGVGTCWPEPLSAAPQKGPHAETMKKKKKAAVEKEDKGISVGAIPSAAERAGIAAAVLLQRLLRGRAIQNEMFQGKVRRLDLIDELKLVQTETLVAPESDAGDAGVDAAIGVHFCEILNILCLEDGTEQSNKLFETQEKWKEIDGDKLQEEEEEAAAAAAEAAENAAAAQAEAIAAAPPGEGGEGEAEAEAGPSAGAGDDDGGVALDGGALGVGPEKSVEDVMNEEYIDTLVLTLVHSVDSMEVIPSEESSTFLELELQLNIEDSGEVSVALT